MKLIIARFFDRRLRFELGNAVTEVELKTRFREREFAREAVGSAGFVVRIWVRTLKIFNRPPASGFKVAKFAKEEADLLRGC
jgi:hypothetical protein|tara:strand:+ start:749 stop:994 length:246 start_codon:yes stop_codon:yes gene_type:complete